MALRVCLPCDFPTLGRGTGWSVFVLYSKKKKKSYFKVNSAFFLSSADSLAHSFCFSVYTVIMFF